MKVASSYQSLVLGVSQQVAHGRRDGQHAGQVNMLPDPVRGLTRRHGTKFVARQLADGVDPFSGTTWSSYLFPCLGQDLIVLSSKQTQITPVACFNASTRAFLPVDIVAASGLPAVGVRSLTSVGRYILLVPGTQTPGRIVFDAVADTGSKSAVWVRGGAYARAFKLTLKASSGAVITASYTTPTSSYQGVLSTADIPYSATDYAKQVNDRVNAYNGAVTAWIGSAAAAIAPAAIAQSLFNAISPADRALLGMTLDGPYLVMTACTEAEASDSGDGTLIRAVATRVLSADELTSRHFFGKTVQVRGQDSAESYYLKASPKGSASGTFGEVVWEEGPGVQWTPQQPWYIGTVQAGTLYIGTNSAALNARVLAATGVDLKVPGLLASTAGDLDNNRPPAFTESPVTYIGSLHDRLIVAAGGKVSCSKTADYFNFSRSTVLTLPADDAFEVAPASGSDDPINFGVLWERGLLFFGDRRQYTLSGKVALTPTSAALPTVSSHEGAGSVQPVVSGTNVFYSKPGDGVASAYELVVGQTTDTTEAFDVSTQLDDYIKGTATELAVYPEPTTLLMRTTGSPRSVYLFNYLDTRGNGRVQDAWSRWDFSPLLGTLAAMRVYRTGLLLFFIREVDGLRYLVCDEASLSSEPSSLPYLDSQRTLSGAVLSTETHAAMGAGTGQWAGGIIGTAAALATRWGRAPVVGTEYTATVELTNPYVRDQKEKAVLTGRTVINKLVVSCSESLGFDWVLTSDGTTTSGTELSRVVGDPGNILGVYIPTDFSRSIPIGRDNKRYTVQLSAMSWLPLTIDNVDWEGQLFNRVRRL